ncbi:RNA-directed DNA polymerase [Burkholderia sp. Ac-20344]|nr:RNA-directed DNA polymerase [Burkholderia sp. Ac-20344]
MPERRFNLVVPLAYEATAMRNEDTVRHGADWSSAVSRPSNRSGDVDSTMVPPTRGIRTSTTATRTTTTRARRFAPWSSADWNVDAEALGAKLVTAYRDCRRTKRNSTSALAFEADLERNLVELHEGLVSGTYVPGSTKCFVITRPKPREVWAAGFPDRVVQHLLYNEIRERFERTFIADSCACIKGRGTLYGAIRLESKILSITENWQCPAYYLKCDIANFFVSIPKPLLLELFLAKIDEPYWRWLTETVLMHDPRADFEYLGDPALMSLVPAHKRLLEQPDHFGLAIGNLISQFAANVLLNELDQFVKHVLRVRHYSRYVDDFIFLDKSPARLNEILAEVTAFLPRKLGVQLNPRKTILQPVDRGVDFVGQVIKPWRRSTRKRTRNEALNRISAVPDGDVHQVANSYFGLLRQATASHHDRAQLANIVRSRGYAVDRDFTKSYRRKVK